VLYDFDVVFSNYVDVVLKYQAYIHIQTSCTIRADGNADMTFVLLLTYHVDDINSMFVGAFSVIAYFYTNFNEGQRGFSNNLHTHSFSVFRISKKKNSLLSVCIK